jgi:hypothetical protein
VNAEFNWWLLIVGLGVGAGLTWLILSDLTQREDELAERDSAEEVAWVGDALAANGRPTSPETIARVLRLHQAYLRRASPEPLEGDAPALPDGPARGDAPAPPDGPARGDSPTKGDGPARGDSPTADAPPVND